MCSQKRTKSKEYTKSIVQGRNKGDFNIFFEIWRRKGPLFLGGICVLLTKGGSLSANRARLIKLMYKPILTNQKYAGSINENLQWDHWIYEVHWDQIYWSNLYQMKFSITTKDTFNFQLKTRLTITLNVYLANQVKR